MREIPEAHRGLVPENILTTTVAIAGLGHLGSHIALSLRRLGVYAFVLYDGDVIEERNLGGSLYTNMDIGYYKVRRTDRAIRSIFSRYLVFVGDSHISPNDTLQPAEFYILATDDAESRLMIFNCILESAPRPDIWTDPVWIIDARTRAHEAEVFLVPIRDEEKRDAYRENLKRLVADPTPPVPCHEANLIQTTLHVTGIVCQIICEILGGNEITSYQYFINSEKYHIEPLPVSRSYY